MPSEKSHIGVANDNHATLEYLLKEPDNHLAWIGTVAFYKALHVVEAVLVTSFATHQTTHTERNRFLASENRLKKIYDHFYPLYIMSQKARYLSNCPERNGQARFVDHISKTTMIDNYLKHHLHQVETSATKFLQNSGDLLRVTNIFL